MKPMPMLHRRDVLLLPATAAVAVTLVAPFPALAQSAGETALAATGGLPENSFGSAQAPVTVIEYASLTCHHCKNFHLNTWPAVKAKYVDTGKVQFVMREFPIDPLAMGAAMLARCSGEKKWYAVVDMLFRTDDAWAHAADPLEGLRGLMRQTGMGNDVFESCLSDQKLLDEVTAVAQRGTTAGVTATPTFFINGRKTAGALTLDQFSALVDPYLTAGE